MPQKGQITKHEWTKVDKLYTFQCKYCKVYKNIYGEIEGFYHENDLVYLPKEPPCITRKIETNDK